MRMWNIHPKKMCNKHLLGEHVECHMFVGCLNKNKNIQGYLDKGLVEVHNIKKRHNNLVKEMKARGFNHKSPLPKYKMKKAGKINAKKNFIELNKRCKECKKINNKK
jgi:hypothetical protein